VTENTRNPWLDIPLADYEGHMSLPAIGQAEMLADQFGILLEKYRPTSVAIIGCAGGNGLDRVCAETTKRVVGVDINPRYVEEASRRYAGRLPGLELYVHDVQGAGAGFEPVDFLYAALLFEYVALKPSLQMLKAACNPNAILAAVLQLPSQSVAAVSPSPFLSLRALEPVMRLVSPEALCIEAAHVGFSLLSSRHVVLPSRKAFAVLVFRRSGEGHK